MGSYRIEWKQSAVKELRQLSKDIRTRVIRAVETLADQPITPNARKLIGVDRTYRIWVGDYRVIYFVHASSPTIEILRVRHRREVYRSGL